MYWEERKRETCLTAPSNWTLYASMWMDPDHVQDGVLLKGMWAQGTRVRLYVLLERERASRADCGLVHDNVVVIVKVAAPRVCDARRR